MKLAQIIVPFNLLRQVGTPQLDLQNGLRAAFGSYRYYDDASSTAYHVAVDAAGERDLHRIAEAFAARTRATVTLVLPDNTVIDIAPAGEGVDGDMGVFDGSALGCRWMGNGDDETPYVLSWKRFVSEVRGHSALPACRKIVSETLPRDHPWYADIAGGRRDDSTHMTIALAAYRAGQENGK